MNLANNQADGNDTRVPKSNGAFLGPLSILVRQKKSWSPALLAGVLWRALTNIDTHREVRGLLKVQTLAETLANNPRFAFKYLAPHYLARNLTLTDRAASFLYHHRRMLAAFPDQLLRKIMQDDLLVHQIAEGSHCFDFSIGLSRPCDKEGELSLNFHVDREIVFVLSFTIVPGSVVRSQDREVLLLTRIQGTPGCYPKIKLASASLHDIGLNSLLFAALQGFATALGIREIVASCATDQTSYTEELCAIFKRAYDDFYLEQGMIRNESAYFVGTIPIEGKPLDQVKKNHKSRTREQRRIKQEIQNIFASYFLQVVNPSEDLSESICFEPAASPSISPSRPISCATWDRKPTL